MLEYISGLTEVNFLCYRVKTQVLMICIFIFFIISENFFLNLSSIISSVILVFFFKNSNDLFTAFSWQGYHPHISFKGKTQSLLLASYWRTLSHMARASCEVRLRNIISRQAAKGLAVTLSLWKKRKDDCGWQIAICLLVLHVFIQSHWFPQIKRKIQTLHWFKPSLVVTWGPLEIKGTGTWMQHRALWPETSQPWVRNKRESVRKVCCNWWTQL